MTPWTIAHQAPLPREFSRQEYWSGQPFPSPGDLPDPGTESGSPALQADSLLSEPPGKTVIICSCNPKIGQCRTLMNSRALLYPKVEDLLSMLIYVPNDTQAVCPIYSTRLGKR